MEDWTWVKEYLLTFLENVEKLYSYEMLQCIWSHDGDSIKDSLSIHGNSGFFLQNRSGEMKIKFQEWLWIHFIKPSISIRQWILWTKRTEAEELSATNWKYPLEYRNQGITNRKSKNNAKHFFLHISSENS